MVRGQEREVATNEILKQTKKFCLPGLRVETSQGIVLYIVNKFTTYSILYSDLVIE